MPCCIQTGHRKRNALYQARIGRELRQLLVRMHALHPRQHAAALQQAAGGVGESSQVRKGARHRDVEALGRLPLFGPPDVDLHVSQTALDHSLAQEGALLVIAVQQRDALLRTRDGQRDSRQAAAAADVDRAPGRDVRHHGQAVEQVVRHQPGRFPDRSEVVGAIPLLQQRDIPQQLVVCARRKVQAECGNAVAEIWFDRHRLRPPCRRR